MLREVKYNTELYKLVDKDSQWVSSRIGSYFNMGVELGCALLNQCFNETRRVIPLSIEINPSYGLIYERLNPENARICLKKAVVTSSDYICGHVNYRRTYGFSEEEIGDTMKEVFQRWGLDMLVESMWVKDDENKLREENNNAAILEKIPMHEFSDIEIELIKARSEFKDPHSWKRLYTNEYFIVCKNEAEYWEDQSQGNTRYSELYKKLIGAQCEYTIFQYHENNHIFHSRDYYKYRCINCHKTATVTNLANKEEQLRTYCKWVHGTETCDHKSAVIDRYENILIRKSKDQDEKIAQESHDKLFEIGFARMGNDHGKNDNSDEIYEELKEELREWFPKKKKDVSEEGR